LKDARSRWELRFYVWRSLVALLVLTAEALDLLVHLIEGRPPSSLDALRALLTR
jgi:hypothetical protein